MGDVKDVTLNMRVRPDILAQIDAAAAKLGESRSQFIRRAAISKALGTVYPSGSLKCPFCGEDDYDAYGLKLHLSVLGCATYGNLEAEVVGA
jgi:hypothetical protein